MKYPILADMEPVTTIQVLRRTEDALRSAPGVYNRGAGKELLIADAGTKECAITILHSGDFCIHPKYSGFKTDLKDKPLLKPLIGKGFPYFKRENNPLGVLVMLSKRDKIYDVRDVQKLAWSAWFYSREIKLEWSEAARLRAILDCVGFNLVHLDKKLFRISFWRTKKSPIMARFNVLHPVQCVQVISRDPNVKDSSLGFLLK